MVKNKIKITNETKVEDFIIWLKGLMNGESLDGYKFGNIFRTVELKPQNKFGDYQAYLNNPGSIGGNTGYKNYFYVNFFEEEKSYLPVIRINNIVNNEYTKKIQQYFSKSSITDEMSLNTFYTEYLPKVIVIIDPKYPLESTKYKIKGDSFDTITCGNETFDLNSRKTFGYYKNILNQNGNIFYVNFKLK